MCRQFGSRKTDKEWLHNYAEENTLKVDNLEDQEADGRIILIWIIEKQFVRTRFK